MSENFELVREWMTISHVNIRTELHGDDNATAVDIKLEHDFHNAVLSKFSPTLLSSIYTQDPGTTKDMINPDFAPHLINGPLVMPLRWDMELDRVKFTIHDDGGDDRNDLVFSGAKANKFAFDCKEGGTVHMVMRIQMSDMSNEQIAEIVGFLQQDVKISIAQEAAPEKDEQDEDEEDPSDNVLSLFPVPDSDAPAADPVVQAINDVAQSDEDQLLYDNVVAYTLDQATVSISMIKRDFKLEVLPATRLIERMEAEEIIGEANGHGLHEVNKEAA